MTSSTFRLTLLFAGSFGISSLLVFAAINWLVSGYMTQQFDATVTDELTEVMTESRDGGLQAIRSVVASETAQPGNPAFYLLQDAQGQVLAGNLAAMEPLTGLRDWSGANQLSDINGKHRDMRGRGIRVEGNGYLFVGFESALLNQTAQRAAITFFGGWAITALLALLGGVAVNARIARRIETIDTAGRDIMEGDLSRRVPLSGRNDEFDRLASGLNALFSRLQALLEGMQQVSNDIAHDLRTPLTRLRQRLELARRRDETVESLREALDASVQDVDAILEIFGALLRIAQIGAGTRRSGFAPLDLGVLLDVVVDAYQPVAEEKHQSLTSNLQDNLGILGDHELLTQMFANLIENAIRHTPEGAVLTVTGRRYPDTIEIEIADTGPGIPEEFHAKVFQRFYRLESSRTTPGDGLGLSLVEAVARLHSAMITLSDNKPGLRVSLSFAVHR